MKRIITGFALLVIALNSSGQAPQKCNCCQDDFRKFDFWLGSWEVTDTLGNFAGESSIISVQDGCVIQENWVSKNLTGTSYNYYNNADSTWNQVWIDNTGSVLVLKGAFTKGKMILESNIQKDAKGKSYYNRISWEKVPDGNVTQTWEIMDDSDQLITQAFKGIYKAKLQK